MTSKKNIKRLLPDMDAEAAQKELDAMLQAAIKENKPPFTKEDIEAFFKEAQVDIPAEDIALFADAFKSWEWDKID